MFVHDLSLLYSHCLSCIIMYFFPGLNDGIENEIVSGRLGERNKERRKKNTKNEVVGGT